MTQLRYLKNENKTNQPECKHKQNQKPQTHKCRYTIRYTVGEKIKELSNKTESAHVKDEQKKRPE